MTSKGSGGFTDVEIAAVKERAAELRAEKGGKEAAAALDDLLKSIEAMPADQRAIAEAGPATVSCRCRSSAARPGPPKDPAKAANA